MVLKYFNPFILGLRSLLSERKSWLSERKSWAIRNQAKLFPFAPPLSRYGAIVLCAVFLAQNTVFLTGHAWGQSLGSNSVSDYAGRELQPRAMLPSYDVANIAPLIAGLGFAVQLQSGRDGSQFLLVEHTSGLKMLIAPRACRAAPNTDCAGVEFGALFPSMSADIVTRFNREGQFARIFQSPNGTVLVQRYDIADYGTPEGNFSVLLRLFLRDTARLALMSGGSGGSNSVNLELEDTSPEDAIASLDADKRLMESPVESHFKIVSDDPLADGLVSGDDVVESLSFAGSFLDGAVAADGGVFNPDDSFDGAAFNALLQSIEGTALLEPAP